MRFAKAYVEITNICNRSCSFCPKTRRAPAFMQPEDFDTILARLSGWTEYLYFHLMGEPLLHPHLARYLHRAGEHGFRVILTTNATLLRQEEEILLSAPALHKVNLSLQSFEANAVGVLEDYVNQCAAFAVKASSQGILINFRLWNLDGDDTTGRNTENDKILSLLSKIFPRPWTPVRGGERLAPGVFLNWARPSAGRTCTRPTSVRTTSAMACAIRSASSATARSSRAAWITRAVFPLETSCRRTCRRYWTARAHRP